MSWGRSCASGALIFAALFGSAGRAAGAPADPARAIGVLVCPLPPQAGEAVAAIHARLNAELEAIRLAGAVVDRSPRPEGACARLEARQPLTPAMPDVVVSLAGVPQDPDPGEIRIGFRWESPEVPDVVLTVEGRRLTGSLASKLLQFPASASSEEAVTATERTLEGQFLEGLLSMMAWRKLAALGDDVSTEARINRTAAARALAAADATALAELAPNTAAVVKQLRAIVLSGGLCDEETPTELTRAAARLVPHSAYARGLAAITRLQEAYEPPRCVAAAERALYAALELDPWNEQAATNLGVLYELAVDARPEEAPGQVLVTEAADRLDQVWKEDAPPPPWAVEGGAAGNIVAAPGQVIEDAPLRAFAPGGRLELTVGRDGPGWGVRSSLSVPWTREIPLKEVGARSERQGSASWTRVAWGVGPRYRFTIPRLRALYGELMASALLASVLAVGQDFDDNDVSSGWDVGGEAGLRVGRRFGNIAAWGGLSASYFFRAAKGDIVAATNAESKELPALDLVVTFGLSVFVWR
jgi:hypothetical protein